MDVKRNLDEIVKEIEAAKKRGNRDDEVHLLAVTKTIDYDLIDESLEWGVTHIGENKVQDLLKRMEHYGDRVKYHFIGNLQTNKVKDIVGKVELIHSVDRKKVAKEINKRAKKANVVQDVLLQLNISKEETKSGVYLEDLDEFVYNILDYENINIRGLMTMAPYGASDEELHEIFSKMRKAKEKLEEKYSDDLTMDYLSMGMTDDFEIAIEEGANIVRIGSGIYGERNY